MREFRGNLSLSLFWLFLYLLLLTFTFCWWSFWNFIVFLHIIYNWESDLIFSWFFVFYFFVFHLLSFLVALFFLPMSSLSHSLIFYIYLLIHAFQIFLLSPFFSLLLLLIFTVFLGSSLALFSYHVRNASKSNSCIYVFGDVDTFPHILHKA